MPQRTASSVSSPISEQRHVVPARMPTLDTGRVELFGADISIGYRLRGICVSPDRNCVSPPRSLRDTVRGHNRPMELLPVLRAEILKPLYHEIPQKFFAVVLLANGLNL